MFLSVVMVLTSALEGCTVWWNSYNSPKCLQISLQNLINVLIMRSAAIIYSKTLIKNPPILFGSVILLILRLVGNGIICVLSWICTLGKSFHGIFLPLQIQNLLWLLLEKHTKNVTLLMDWCFIQIEEHNTHLLLFGSYWIVLT